MTAIPKRVEQHTGDQVVDVPAPRGQEQLYDAIQFTPQRPAGLVADKSSEVPGPQNQAQIVGGVPGTPTVRVSQRTGEHWKDVPAPPQARTAGTSQQTVDAPVSSKTKSVLAAEEVAARAALGRLAKMEYDAVVLEQLQELNELRLLREHGVRLNYQAKFAELGGDGMLVEAQRASTIVSVR